MLDLWLKFNSKYLHWTKILVEMGLLVEDVQPQKGYHFLKGLWRVQVFYCTMQPRQYSKMVLKYEMEAKMKDDGRTQNDAL